MRVAYPIGAVSKLTRISVDTLRAWERRHAAVVPKRGNRRRGYDQADIERLILLRRAVESGHSISSVARLADGDLRALLAQDRKEPGATALIQPLLLALEDFDYASLNEQLGRMAAVLAPVEIVHQVALPVMKEVGEHRRRGQLSIAQEHMMSELIRHLLGSLLRLFRPAADTVKLILTTPEGQPHALGILAAAILAAEAGLSPIYLGTSLSAKEIVNAVRSSGSSAVLLQIIDSSVSAAAQVRELLEMLPSGVELWLGGSAEFGQSSAISIPDFSTLKQHCQRLAAS